MTAIDTATAALHLLFAGLWAGAVAFVATGVLPTARDGDIGPDALDAIAARLTTVSRVSAVVLLLTGAHLAATRYDAASLTGTGRGHLVLTMVALWLALAALVEVGTSRLRDGLAERKVRDPARRSARLYQTAAVVGVVLLLLGSVLVA